MAETFEVIGSYRSTWGEGPIWWDGRLIYVDIEGHKVISFDPKSGEEQVYDVGERVGTVVPRKDGGFVIAGDTGYHFLNAETGEVTAIHDPEPEKENNRFNDGKCSPDGRFFAGTISMVKKTGDAALYRLDQDQSLHVAHANITNGNGIVWTGDEKTCFFIDTPTMGVTRFDYDTATGELKNPSQAFSTKEVIEASPDGMTIDSDGNLWIAFCHGACVICFSQTGELLKRVDLPCLETTAVAFGGENLEDLYVTTGVHKSEVEEHAGRLFVIKGLGVRGVPANPYTG